MKFIDGTRLWIQLSWMIELAVGSMPCGMPDRSSRIAICAWLP